MKMLKKNGLFKKKQFLLFSYSICHFNQLIDSSNVYITHMSTNGSQII